MIKKAVITAAGLGTRLLPATKNQPKEMLPLFVSKNGNRYLKPICQIFFEQLYSKGIKNFCFIIGQGARTIQDHFTSDNSLLEILESKGNNNLLEELKYFQKILNDTNISWIRQTIPKGFGDAVYTSKNFVGSDSFFVYGGDECIISNINDDFLKRLIDTHIKFDADCTLLVEKVKDPENYGVIIGEQIGKTTWKVNEIIEKPKNPKSNLTAIAVYIFKPTIFDFLEKVPFKNNEKQLTDAIQLMIKDGCKIYAEGLEEGEVRLDSGRPEKYKIALDKSYELLKT